MQYVRNLGGSVSAAWGSINPATLSGAIDVIVVEQDDGSLSCSPFHVRFGKLQLLRPYEKKVEFKVNGKKYDYPMKLGEGGEAFFVLGTRDIIPQSLQTSPLASPESSPTLAPQSSALTPSLQEPDQLDLDPDANSNPSRPPPLVIFSTSQLQASGSLSSMRPHSDDGLGRSSRTSEPENDYRDLLAGDLESSRISDESQTSPPHSRQDAREWGIALSKKLLALDIPSQVTTTGDVMLDMTAYENGDLDRFQVENIAQKVSENDLGDGNDIGALMGLDERGNIWIYNSEEAKDAAMRQMTSIDLPSLPVIMDDTRSDPGHQGDGSDSESTDRPPRRRTGSDVGGMVLEPITPGASTTAGDPNLNYAKTLRLTSEQLKALDLKPGENSMSFTVNRSTCKAYMFLWKHETPVVVSDIDGTITKSDVFGHLMNMVGRDWTHPGVAKLYSDIETNGYNIMYLTSRSVGQADTTRAYLHGVHQDGCKLPRGPTILSPDRTMAALRREIYLRQPQVFKMATLRDIRKLYGGDTHSFYAGFGNRLTDQLSYRSVDIPRNRIFTINSNAEVLLDVFNLSKLKLSYVNINEVVDHYFPAVSLLLPRGAEEFTDFMYWRDVPREVSEYTTSDSEGGAAGDEEEEYPDEEDDEVGEGMAESYMSQASVDEGSVLSGSVGEGEEQLMDSIMEEEENADDELDVDEDERDGEVDKDIVEDRAAEEITGIDKMAKQGEKK